MSELCPTPSWPCRRHPRASVMNAQCWVVCRGVDVPRRTATRSLGGMGARPGWEHQCLRLSLRDEPLLQGVAAEPAGPGRNCLALDVQGRKSSCGFNLILPLVAGSARWSLGNEFSASIFGSCSKLLCIWGQGQAVHLCRPPAAQHLGPPATPPVGLGPPAEPG